MSELKLPDIDEEKATRKFSWRERMAFNLLWLMFCMIYPVKYQHQIDKLHEALTKDF